MKLSIVIPCFNEKNTIEEILNRVISVSVLPWQKEIIVVNDASTDGTGDILKKFESRVKIIHLMKNEGKGTAVKRGLEEATGDYIIIQDADLEYDPKEIPSLLGGVNNNNVVYGSRNLHHIKRKGFYSQRLGVWFITKLINKLYSVKLTDVWTCYKLFPKEAKKYFVLGRFEAELIFTISMAHEGYSFAEKPITHVPRNMKEGKKIRYRDGVRAIQLILAHRLLNIKKPKVIIKKDHTSIICCPLCKSDLLKERDGYVCRTHGYYHVDESGRPILIEANVYKDNTLKHESGVNWLKSFLKQFPKIYYSIWHIFCPVMMLVNGPRMVISLVKKDALIVDIGSGPERLGKEFINVDVFPFPEVDIVSDATHLPFKDNSIDAAVSESLFEHVPDAHLVAREMVRVIKPGGYIYVSAPFIHPYHASPDDFNRWTISGLKHMFKDLEIVEAGVRSGPWSAMLLFMAYWLGVIFSFGSQKTAPFLAHIFMLILGPLKYFDYFFMKIPGSEAVATHLYVLGKKK
jgi:glycosyltransferase involved in cell wall biosynthesis